MNTNADLAKLSENIFAAFWKQYGYEGYPQVPNLRLHQLEMDTDQVWVDLYQNTISFKGCMALPEEIEALMGAEVYDQRDVVGNYRMHKNMEVSELAEDITKAFVIYFGEDYFQDVDEMGIFHDKLATRLRQSIHRREKIILEIDGEPHVRLILDDSKTAWDWSRSKGQFITVNLV